MLWTEEDCVCDQPEETDEEIFWPTSVQVLENLIQIAFLIHLKQTQNNIAEDNKNTHTDGWRY